MNTFQIAEQTLAAYKKEKLSDERIDFLVSQANEQIEEISKDKEIYTTFLNKVNAPKKTDNIILWILFMSNDDICCEYIDVFNKDFNDTIPVSDLADLLFHVIYVKKVNNIELDGFNYLAKYTADDIEDVDNYCITNVLAYIQKSKEVAIEF
jgi:hypothetical protein